MLELGSRSRKYHEELSKLLTILILIKYSLKETKQFSHINFLKKKKEEIFYKISKI